MTDFLKMAAGLSIYNSGEYAGYVIGRAEWQLEGEIQSVKSEIKTERKGYVVIEVAGYDSKQVFAGRLNVTMLKVKSEFIAEQKERNQKHRKGEILFTEEQVKHYLEEVQDTNPIHRGRKAIVPGLMLIDFLLDCGSILLGKQRHIIRFREPLAVGSPFMNVVKGEKICIISTSQTVCYAEVDK